MPNVLSSCQGGPLERDSEGGILGRNGDVEFADALALCAPYAQADGMAGAVADFSREERGVRVVLKMVSAQYGEAGVPEIHTMVRPFMPMMKSNQGSMGRSWLVLRRIWKPKAPLEFWSGSCGSASRREMKRFRAPNMLMAACDWVKVAS